jgi:hypothetical protein
MRARAATVLSWITSTLITLAAPAWAGPPVCSPRGGTGPVQAPVFVWNLSGQTSWYASSVVHDLDGDDSNELIAAYYDVYVFSSAGTLLDRAENGSGRVYAPHVVADLDGDGTTEVVVGRGNEVIAFEWSDSRL